MQKITETHTEIKEIQKTSPTIEDIEIKSQKEQIIQIKKPNEVGIRKKKTISDQNSAKIEKIILHNFLSFIDDEVNFDSKFTIITGPNGAGKSSIYQALKFALGSNNYDERYSKWEDFIRLEATEMTVRVYIKFKNEQYIVQRSISKKKTIKYSFKSPSDSKIHNVRFQTIQKFLNEIRIEPDNDFAFMSQGNIDVIKNFKERTLCEFIEHGIGLNQLREQILNQKDKISILNREFNTLQSQRNNLKYQLVELEPKLKRLEKKHILLKKLEQLNEELSFAQKKELEAQIETLELEKVEIQNQMSEISRILGEIDIELKKLEESIADKKDELRTLESEVDKKKNRKQFLTDLLNKMESEKNDIADKIQELSGKIIKHQTQINNFSIEISNIVKQQDQITKKIKEKTEELSIHQKEQQKLNAEVQQHQAILLEYTKNKQEQHFILENISRTKKEHQELEERISQKLQEIQHIKHDLDKYQWFMKDPTQNLQNKLKKDYKSTQNAITVYNQDLGILQDQYNEIYKLITKIKNSNLDKSLPKPREITKLMEEIRNRKIDCIGPLINYISFDDLYREAVTSIFSKRILLSFVAKNDESFSRLKHLAQNLGARCNLYLGRKVNLTPLPSLADATNNGVFGYLADKINLLNEDLDIKKVIYSVAGKTLIVKDHNVGTNFIKNFNYHSRIVTLDGEQIQQKKFVIEARPFIKSRGMENIGSVAQAKEHLKKMNDEVQKNRENYNHRTSDLKKLEARSITLQKRLREIEGLLQKFKKLEIATVFKNKRIEERKELYLKIKRYEEDNLQKSIIMKDLEEKLPDNLIVNQKRMQELPKLIIDLQDTISQYQKSLLNYQKQIGEKETKKAIIETELKQFITRKDQLEDELKTSDAEYFRNFKENTELADQLEKLSKKIDSIRIFTEEFEKNQKELHDKRDNQNIELIRYQTNIDINEQKILEINKKLAIIEEKIEQNPLSVQNIRPILEIQKDIARQERELSFYRDIDDHIIDEKAEIEASIKEIANKRKIVEDEIIAAEKAQKRLEHAYYENFQSKISQLNISVNEKIQQANLDFKAKIQLTGEIESLGMSIIIIRGSLGKEKILQFRAISGGERSMVGICLMLSLNNLNPSPLNIYDECDMFLDEKNAQTVAQLIKLVADSGIQFVMLMPDKNRALLQYAEKVIGVCKNGKQGSSTILYTCGN